LERYLLRRLASNGWAGWRVTRETVKRPMKILILMAIFSAIAAACYRQEQGEQPEPAA
jgi:hypothetical protein